MTMLIKFQLSAVPIRNRGRIVENTLASPPEFSPLFTQGPKYTKKKPPPPFQTKEATLKTIGTPRDTLRHGRRIQKHALKAETPPRQNTSDISASQAKPREEKQQLSTASCGKPSQTCVPDNSEYMNQRTESTYSGLTAVCVTCNGNILKRVEIFDTVRERGRGEAIYLEFPSLTDETAQEGVRFGGNVNRKRNAAIRGDPMDPCLRIYRYTDIPSPPHIIKIPRIAFPKLVNEKRHMSLTRPSRAVRAKSSGSDPKSGSGSNIQKPERHPKKDKSSQDRQDNQT
ncbi:hypothetical protein B0O99DRAFT_599394 [Bisporella sp. PMI_857]|nr:hypothetical protein B0O99DRAFT_599394 [Bisporella sp. PMI_857]